MRAPAERTHHMAEPAHGRESAIQRRTANGVIDEVETAIAGQTHHERLDGL